MKKIVNKISILLVAVLLTLSCSKTEVVQTDTLEERIAKDASLKKSIDAATELYSNLYRTYINNSDQYNAELQGIIERINNKTATDADYARVEAITGTSYDEFVGGIKKFATSLAELNNQYPELSKMKASDLQTTFENAIKLNPELQGSLGVSAVVNGRVEACPLRDICNLAVALTKLFAGDPICAAIGVTTIPVVGGLLCSIVLNIGSAILVGICNALPC